MQALADCIRALQGSANRKGRKYLRYFKHIVETTQQEWSTNNEEHTTKQLHRKPLPSEQPIPRVETAAPNHGPTTCSMTNKSKPTPSPPRVHKSAHQPSEGQQQALCIAKEKARNQMKA